MTTKSYQGVFKKSRTLDTLALHSCVTAMFPVLDAALPSLGLTVTHMAIYNIAVNALLWYLRYKTTGAVGDK
jgi:hypothetical protein